MLIFILVASILIIGYITWYTKKKINKLKEIDNWTTKLIP